MIEETLSYLILGVVQGLTEFLPVSSSGHLTLFSEFLGIKSDDITFKVLVHVSTALSTIIVFRKDIVDLTLGFPKKTEEGEKARKYILLLALSAIPAALVGFTLKDTIEALDYPQFVGYMLIVTALILLASQKLNSHLEKNLGISNSILIGISQAFAILPGVSRSGVTISTALVLGWKRSDAAKFSFLLGIPAISIASIVELISYLNKFNSFSFLPLIVGLITTFVSSLFAIDFLLRYFSSNGLKIFIIYRVVFGFLILLNL